MPIINTYLVISAFSLIAATGAIFDDVSEEGLQEWEMDRGIRWTLYVLEKNDTPKSLFGKYADDAARFNKMAKKYWKKGVEIRRPHKADLPLLKDWTPLSEVFEKCLPRPSTAGRGKSETDVCILISLKEQFLGVYKKGTLKLSYPVSTGNNKKECGDPPGSKYCKTPTGSFEIKNKKDKVFSARYKVWMHHAMHIGRQIYIHVGDLPGYPASHGCIRMFKKDAKTLFKMTPKGTRVYIIK